jgi:hypothetical protein
VFGYRLRKHGIDTRLQSLLMGHSLSCFFSWLWRLPWRSWRELAARIGQPSVFGEIWSG